MVKNKKLPLHEGKEKSKETSISDVIQFLQFFKLMGRKIRETLDKHDKKKDDIS